MKKLIYIIAIFLCCCTFISYSKNGNVFDGSRNQVKLFVVEGVPMMFPSMYLCFGPYEFVIRSYGGEYDIGSYSIHDDTLLINFTNTIYLNPEVKIDSLDSLIPYEEKLLIRGDSLIDITDYTEVCERMIKDWEKDFLS